MNVKEKLSKLVLNKNVYCYGAGNYGKIVSYALMEIGALQKGFIVTDKNKNPKKILKMPVWELNDIDIGERDIILICVNSLFQEEIKIRLIAKGIKNYYCFSEDMIEKLDKATTFTFEGGTDKYINVLLYHRVCELKEDPWKIAIEPSEFERQIQYLKQNFDILRFEDDWSNIKRKSIVITFDDGYVDNFKYAIPVLQKYDVPATIFVSTDNIGKRESFWWDKLANMIFGCTDISKKVYYNNEQYYLKDLNDKKIFCQKIRKHMMNMNAQERKKAFEKLSLLFPHDLKENEIDRTMNEEELKQLSKMPFITIGAHTKGHCKLSALDEAEQFEEIRGSKDILEQIIGKKVMTFSYPFGNKEDYTQKTVDFVRRCGFTKAAAVKGGLYSSEKGEYEIPRNNIPGGTDLNTLKKIIRKIWYEY